MNRIIIAVRGGVVQEVTADDPKGLKVIVFDVDNMRSDDENMTETEVDKAWKELTEGTKVIL